MLAEIRLLDGKTDKVQPDEFAKFECLPRVGEYIEGHLIKKVTWQRYHNCNEYGYIPVLWIRKE